ncbi:Uncharacterised protein [Klebsiella pneumoniae]|nr:Uncharacterised protein [Klebsiella pneumoniae]
MTQHEPGLIEDDECRTTIQRFFNATEEIEQHRQRVFLIHVHEMFNLERHEVRNIKTIFFCIEQMTHVAINGVLFECLTNDIVLNRNRKFRQGFGVSLRHTLNGVSNSISHRSINFDPVQDQNGFNPFHRPCAACRSIQS